MSAILDELYISSFPGSFEERRDNVRRAIQQTYFNNPSSGSPTSFCIEAMFADSALISYCPMKQDPITKYYSTDYNAPCVYQKIGYTVDKDGNVTLGDAKDVKIGVMEEALSEGVVGLPSLKGVLEGEFSTDSYFKGLVEMRNVMGSSDGPLQTASFATEAQKKKAKKQKVSDAIAKATAKSQVKTKGSKRPVRPATQSTTSY